MDGCFIPRNHRPGTIKAGFHACPNPLCVSDLPRVSDRHCRSLSAGFCNRWPEPPQKRYLSADGTCHSCLLPAFFKDCRRWKKEGEEETAEDENTIKLDLKNGQRMDEDEFREQLKKDRKEEEDDDEL